MYTATRANVRTTVAAAEKGASEALTVAFFGGSIMGLTVASAGLLGLGLLYWFWGHEHAEAIHGFGMGASSVALFSRVGGGIFTKSADVGADLVGKIEAGIRQHDRIDRYCINHDCYRACEAWRQRTKQHSQLSAAGTVIGWIALFDCRYLSG